MHVLGQRYCQINCYYNQIVPLKLQKYLHTEIIVVSKRLKDMGLFVCSCSTLHACFCLLWLKCHQERKQVWLSSQHLAQPPFSPAFCSSHLIIISLPQNTLLNIVFLFLVATCLSISSL